MSNTGSDHVYREKVANQYVKSAQFKSKLKSTILITGISYVLVIVHLCNAMEMIKVSGMSSTPFEPWEYLYLGTLLFSLFGYLSIQSSKSSFLYMLFYGTILITIPSLIWGAYTYFLICTKTNKNMKPIAFGLTLECVISGLICIAVLLHALSLYYSNVLLQAWNKRGHKVK